ncbi:syndecan-3-like [Sardina pilchardus]|uniref:syndecan-3-like n=1 Tax=Sardina pilchardus TaxID=27697 RepID=UPI002E12D713
MRIHLISIGLLVFYISSLVSALSSSTDVPPEDLDTSGDDAEFSGSGSGSGEDAFANDNKGALTNVTAKPWITDAPLSTAQQTTEKIPIVINETHVSASLSPITTSMPPMESLPHHTTNIPIHDIVGALQTTTPSAEKVDITAAPVAEEVTTQSIVDNTNNFVEEVTTEIDLSLYTTEESTTALVSGTEEEGTFVTTTVQQPIIFDETEEEVEGKTAETTTAAATTTTTTTTVAVIVDDEEEGTSVPEIFDETNEMPSLASTTTSSAPIKDTEMPSLASSTTSSAPIGNNDDDFVVDNIVPDIVPDIVPEVRMGVDRPMINEELTKDGGRSSESSSEHQTLLERKEVLAGVICGGVVGLALAVMLVSIMAYRMKKKDEGSYALDDHKPFNGDYQIVKKQEEFLA